MINKLKHKIIVVLFQCLLKYFIIICFYPIKLYHCNMINTQEQLRNKVKELIPNQKEVARSCEIDPTYFNKWLKGHVSLGSRKLDRVIEWVQNR